MNKNTSGSQVDYIFKIILIGGQNVGKSALLNRYVDNIFTDKYVSTIGVDFKIKTVKVDTKTIKLQIWDTAGQERFNALTSSHYKGAHSCICVYDISSQKSFQEAERYLDQAIEQYNISKQSVYLIGNKKDLIDQREVIEKDGKELAKQFGCNFYEGSAKEDTNIQQIFQQMSKNLVSSVISQGFTDQTLQPSYNNQNSNEQDHTQKKKLQSSGVEIRNNRGFCC